MASTAFAAMEPIIIYDPIIPNMVQDKFYTAQLEKLGGLLEARVDINLEKRLLQIDSAILLSGF